MNAIQMTSFKSEQYSIFVFGVVKYVKHELKSSCTLPRYFSCSLLHPHPPPHPHPHPLTPAYPFFDSEKCSATFCINTLPKYLFRTIILLMAYCVSNYKDIFVFLYRYSKSSFRMASLIQRTTSWMNTKIDLEDVS